MNAATAVVFCRKCDEVKQSAVVQAREFALSHVANKCRELCFAGRRCGEFCRIQQTTTQADNELRFFGL